MLKSIAAFLITLESNRSKYDAVQRGEALFSEQEERGYQLFKQQCNACHTEPLFTNGGFRSNGIALSGDDFGRGEITGIASDTGLFKVPTLRNIYYSRPYMHDGRTIAVDQLTIFPNPGTDFVAAQMKGLNTVEWKVELYDVSGKLVQTTTLYPGSTIAYFDTRTLYSGEYLMVFTHGQTQVSKHVQVVK
jgi:hypothetical protein